MVGRRIAWSRGDDMRRSATVIALLSLTACGPLLPPQTPAAFFSGYSYVPLDPLPVKVVDGPNCGPGKPRGKLLDVLPDNAVRIAVRQLSGSASLGFGPAAQLGYEGNSYEVVLDYINADVANLRFAYDPPRPNGRGSRGALESGAAAASLTRIEEGAADPPNKNVVVIPVYVGVGLRLTAIVTVHKGKVNLSSLGALSAKAEAGQVSGSMIVQTLGITGPKVTTALPIPSELNPSTIQAAIVSLGAVRALIPDAPGTVLKPRVTGIYNPIQGADQTVIHKVVSKLVEKPVEWTMDCPL